MAKRGGAATAGICALLFAGGCGQQDDAPQAMAGGDARHGRRVIEAVGCGACHTIPGVRWPRGQVGPSLEGFGERALIAGRFPNEPETLARWVRDAPSLAPETGMPPMPISEQEARHVAAYLYTLDAR